MKKIAHCRACKVELVNYRASYCKKHFKAGEWNHMWKGDRAGYVTIHNWIIRQIGKPSYCEHCKRSDKKKYEWANIDHKYRRVTRDYIRLCTSCHRIYDRDRGVKIN